VKRFLLKIPSAFAVWTVKMVTKLRVELQTPHGNCWIKCLPCGHLTLERNFWKFLLSSSRKKWDDLICPVCEQIIVTNEFNELLTANSMKMVFTEQNILENLSNITKDDSLQLFLQLPTTLDSHLKTEKKKKFRGLPMCILDSMYLGTFQAKRQTELFKAAEKGNYKRIHFLILAGVQIDDVNEYGQTPLFLASWYGNKKVVEVLVHYGADQNIADNKHILPYLAAFYAGHLEIYRFLSNHKNNQKQNNNEDAKMSNTPQFTLSGLSEKMTVTVLIDLSSTLIGAGSVYIDNCFSDDFLNFLEKCCLTMPVQPPQKECCSDRIYYCDIEGSVRREFSLVFQEMNKKLSMFNNNGNIVVDDELTTKQQKGTGTLVTDTLPHMRFLYYRSVGGFLPPHTDLSRKDRDSGRLSTHTFILYLSDCESGGETVLLKTANRNVGDEQYQIAKVKPKRGRLLLFPHACPHEALAVEQVPKILLRGECL